MFQKSSVIFGLGDFAELALKFGKILKCRHLERMKDIPDRGNGMSRGAEPHRVRTQ